MDKALERGERPSGASGRDCSIGIESLRDLKSKREELVERTLCKLILPVSSLNAATSSTTIFPPGCSNAVTVADAAEAVLRAGIRKPEYVKLGENVETLVSLGIEGRRIGRWSH